MSTSKTRLVAIFSLATLTASLVGCAPTNVPITSSPTAPTTSTSKPEDAVTSAPENEDEARDQSERAIATFLKIRGEVNAAGGTDTEKLKTYAVGSALKTAVDDAKRIAKDKKKTAGALTFEPSSSYVTDLLIKGKSYPFSSASITGCQDGSQYEITLSDGSAAPRPEARAELEFDVIWDPSDEIWLVKTIIATGKSC